MDHIEFVALREVRRFVPREGVYALRKDRKHLWLQRLAIWVLKKLGAEWIEESIAYKRIAIDARTFMERLYKQREELFRHFGRDGTTLLIGATDYEEMMGTSGIRQMLSFNAECRRNSEIMGLEVKVIPWMRGVVVI